MAKALVLVVILSFLSACSSSPKKVSQPLNAPLNAIYASVESSLTMGIQSYSENKREMLSRPFIVSSSSHNKNNKFHERGRAKVLISGSERPYTVETQVYIERAPTRLSEDDTAYSIVRYDKGLATKLLKSILAHLTKNTRDKNVIDDFQAF